MEQSNVLTMTTMNTSPAICLLVGSWSLVGIGGMMMEVDV